MCRCDFCPWSCRARSPLTKGSKYIWNLITLAAPTCYQYKRPTCWRQENKTHPWSHTGMIRLRYSFILRQVASWLIMGSLSHNTTPVVYSYTSITPKVCCHNLMSKPPPSVHARRPAGSKGGCEGGHVKLLLLLLACPLHSVQITSAAFVLCSDELPRNLGFVDTQKNVGKRKKKIKTSKMRHDDRISRLHDLRQSVACI